MLYGLFFVVCDIVCLCGAVLLHVFVCFVCELLCAVIWFVVFCVNVSPQTNSFGGMSH